MLYKNHPTFALVWSEPPSALVSLAHSRVFFLLASHISVWSSTPVTQDTNDDIDGAHPSLSVGGSFFVSYSPPSMSFQWSALSSILVWFGLVWSFNLHTLVWVGGSALPSQRQRSREWCRPKDTVIVCNWLSLAGKRKSGRAFVCASLLMRLVTNEETNWSKRMRGWKKTIEEGVWSSCPFPLFWSIEELHQIKRFSRVFHIVSFCIMELWMHIYRVVWVGALIFVCLFYIVQGKIGSWDLKSIYKKKFSLINFEYF